MALIFHEKRENHSAFAVNKRKSARLTQMRSMNDEKNIRRVRMKEIKWEIVQKKHNSLVTCVKQLFRSQFSAWSSPTRPKKLLIVSRYHTRSSSAATQLSHWWGRQNSFFSLLVWVTSLPRFHDIRTVVVYRARSSEDDSVSLASYLAVDESVIWFVCAHRALLYLSNVLTPYSNGVVKVSIEVLFFCGTNSKPRMEEWNFKFFKLSFYPKKSSQNRYFICDASTHKSQVVSEKAFSTLAIGSGSGLLRHRKSPPSKPYKKKCVVEKKDWKWAKAAKLTLLPGFHSTLACFVHSRRFFFLSFIIEKLQRWLATKLQ